MSNFKRRYYIYTLCFINFLFSAFFMQIASTFAENADTAFQKEIATYELWTVVVDFQDVSIPRCKVKGVAMSSKMDYSGPVTLWKQQFKNQTIPLLEIGLFKNKKSGVNDAVPLKQDSSTKHTLMIKNMSVKGTRRDSFAYMALFNIGNGMIEKMMVTDFAISTLIDLKGKEHDLIITLKGLKQAWSHCDPKK